MNQVRTRAIFQLTAISKLRGQSQFLVTVCIAWKQILRRMHFFGKKYALFRRTDVILPRQSRPIYLIAYEAKKRKTIPSTVAPPKAQLFELPFIAPYSLHGSRPSNKMVVFADSDVILLHNIAVVIVDMLCEPIFDVLRSSVPLPKHTCVPLRIHGS